MASVKDFFKKETVLCIAGVLAVISCFFTPPSAAYVGYINFSTLAMLFSLMSVVAGMREIGVFDLMSRSLLGKVHSMRGISLVLVILSFFLSMFLTNDVALVTMVPFTILTLPAVSCGGMLMHTLVMETIAANLGSMLTPFGNPQNLYLYAAYGYEMGDFLMLMLPYTALSFVLVIICTLAVRIDPAEHVGAEATVSGTSSESRINVFQFAVYAILFLLSILSVARLIDYRITFAIVVAAILVIDRRLLGRVDYSLLVTFVFFFIFIGNLGNISAVRDFLQNILSGREVLVSILASQVTSNVPAAILLSGFTSDGASLIIGTNLGGLGTLIASMASLITYKFYAAACPDKKGSYIARFSIYSVILLAILYSAHLLIR